MICAYCSTQGYDNSFTIGCKSYKLDSIVKHEASKLHKKAAEIEINKAKPVEQSDARKIILSLNKDIYNKLDKMFRTCQSIVLHDRPISDFIWSCEVDEMKGLSIGETYRNTNSAKVFVKSMAEVQFKNIEKVLSHAKFITVIGDGSTDKAVLEQEMWFARSFKLTETSERVSSDAKSKTKAFLKVLKSRTAMCDGPHLRKSNLRETLEYKGVKLINNPDFSKEKFLDNIILALEGRFAEFQTSEAVIKATCIADLKSWPHDWDSLKVFGDQDLRVLLSHYEPLLKEAGVSTDDAEIEWTSLKRGVHDSLVKSGVIPDWVFLNVKFGDEAPNILAIMDLILSLSPSSAEAEKGFSHLKLIKTNIRSKMGHDLLNHSLVIKLESPDVKHFDPHKSIMHWNTSGSRARRPLSKSLGIREIIKTPSSNVEMDISKMDDETEVEMEQDVHDENSSDVDEPTDDETDESENELSVFNDLLEYEYECKF
ncbi:unnamed protein product [Mytilus coruscus]|uniref:C17orf113 probable zinc finger domain-containing protein n=1 Tax=Mytilus coruscus TaxID=42192 RepID=A0A6J8AAR2_MYTCO|nr:unnamed protein product [Mytilus coruscus]